MKVGEAVAAALVDEGVQAVFSLLGDANMDVVLGLAARGVRVYECRHEAVAMAMADGYARTTDTVALCAVTAGPAFAHTFVPLTSASRAESAVVVLTGPRSRDDTADRQALDHEGLTRLTGGRYMTVANPDAAVDRVRAAVDVARSDRKPVVLDVPADLQALDYPWDLETRPRAAWQHPQRVPPDPATVAAAANIVASAERPVILAGGGAVRSGARSELVALAADTGALLATALNARGWFHGETYDAGVAGLYATPAATELFADADCVVSFGASMNRYTTMDGYLFPAARFVQVDIKHPAPMESGQAADCYVQGDALAVAQALRRALRGGTGRGRFRAEERVKRLRADPDERVFDIEPGTLDPRALCANLDQLLPDECGWVSGNSGHFWGFPIMHMSRWRQPMLFGTFMGAIGYGIPVALGAALADTSRPVVVFEGDASLMLNIHVLETMARYSAHLLVIVMNDRALGAEFHKMVAKGHDPSLAVTPEIDLVAIANGMGCPATTVTDITQLPGVVADFLAGSGPLVVDARISRSVVSLPFRRMFFGET